MKSIAFGPDLGWLSECFRGSSKVKEVNLSPQDELSLRLVRSGQQIHLPKQELGFILISFELAPTKTRLVLTAFLHPWNPC